MTTRIPTEEQMCVIQEESRDLFLYASAGTGKTFTVARKVSYALEHGLNVEDILCLTFTSKAANEMRADVMAETDGKEVLISTIHGFCYQVLKETATLRGIYSFPSVCDSVDAEQILKDVTLREMEEIYAKSILAKHGFHIDALSQCCVVKEQEADEWYWEVKLEGKDWLLSQRGELFESSALRLAKSWNCPYCNFPMERGNVCPKCGGDLGVFIQPRLKAKISLYNLVSAVRHYRELYDIKTANAKEDYNATVKRMEEDCPTVLAKLYSNAGKTDAEDVTFRSKTQSWVGDIITYYERALRERNLIDFDDMVIQSLSILSDAEIEAKYRERFKLVIVDEAQDTSQLEYRVIQHLFAPNNRIVFCGDYFQSIYGWRGAAPNYIQKEYVKERNALILKLTHNLRSTASLNYAVTYYLAAAFGGEPPPPPQVIEPAVEIHASATPDAQIEWVYNRLSEMSKEERGQSCVMARSNRLLEGAMKDFGTLTERNNLVQFYRTDEDSRLLMQPVVKNALAFLKLLVNPLDMDSLERLLNNCLGYAPATLRGVRSKRSSGIAITDFLNETTIKNDYYAPLLESIKNGQCVVFDLETTGLNLSSDEAIEIAAKKGNETFLRYVKSTCPISASAGLTHGITSIFLASHGEEKRKALTELATFMNGCVLVGHNSANFDIKMLKREFMEEGITFPHILGHFDTMTIAKRIFNKLPNFKLSTLCTQFGIVNEHAHDALSDVIATEKVLQFIAVNLEETICERIQYYAKHSRKFSEIREDYNKYVTRLESGSSCIEIFEEIKNKYLKVGVEEQPAIQIFEKILNSTQGNGYALIAAVTRATNNGEAEWQEKLCQKGEVAVLSVHKAKGCEFDNVFLIDADDSNFPSYFAVKEGTIEEEKRVFYVALSRAKKRMVLVYPQSKYNVQYEKRFTCRPSRFFDYLPQEGVLRT